MQHSTCRCQFCIFPQGPLSRLKVKSMEKYNSTYSFILNIYYTIHLNIEESILKIYIYDQAFHTAFKHPHSMWLMSIDP